LRVPAVVARGLRSAAGPRDRRPPGRGQSRRRRRGHPSSRRRRAPGTTSAPCSTASAAMEARLPGRRCSGGRPPERGADEALAAGSDQDRGAEEPELPEVPEEEEVVAGSLPEADARVDPDPLAGRRRRRPPGRSVPERQLDHLGDHVVVARVRLHRLRASPGCASGRARRRPRPPRVASPGRARARSRRSPAPPPGGEPPGPRRLAGVDGDRHVARARTASRTGSTRSSSTWSGTSAGAGTGRLSARCRSGRRRPGRGRGVPDGGVALEVPSSVAEAVGVTFTTPIRKVRSPQRKVRPPRTAASGGTSAAVAASSAHASSTRPSRSATRARASRPGAGCRTPSRRRAAVRGRRG
jgi:hypothetical protein